MYLDDASAVAAFCLCAHSLGVCGVWPKTIGHLGFGVLVAGFRERTGC